MVNSQVLWTKIKAYHGFTIISIIALCLSIYAISQNISLNEQLTEASEQLYTANMEINRLQERLIKAEGILKDIRNPYRCAIWKLLGYQEGTLNSEATIMEIVVMSNTIRVTFTWTPTFTEHVIPGFGYHIWKKGGTIIGGPFKTKPGTYEYIVTGLKPGSIYYIEPTPFYAESWSIKIEELKGYQLKS